MRYLACFRFRFRYLDHHRQHHRFPYTRCRFRCSRSLSPTLTPLPATSCVMLPPKKIKKSTHAGHSFNKHRRPNAIQAATTLLPIAMKYVEENDTPILAPDHLLATHQRALPVLLSLAINVHA